MKFGVIKPVIVPLIWESRERSSEVFDAANQIMLENVVLGDDLVGGLDYVLLLLLDEELSIAEPGTIAETLEGIGLRAGCSRQQAAG